MKLSISLPSIYPAALERTLKNIQATTRSDHEVLVVSPTRPPNIGNVIWVQDFVNQGCNAGHCQALIKARGEFLFPFCDDHLLKPDWDIVLISEFRAREFLVGQPFILGVRQDTREGQVGTVFGIYYPYFPLMRTVDAKASGWYQPDFRAGFGDCDLALRFWYAGGKIEWSGEGWIEVHKDDERKGSTLTTEADMALFLSRWRWTYGKKWPCANLRDFNRDVTFAGLPKSCRTFSPTDRAFFADRQYA